MVLRRFGNDLTGLTFALWGLAFKPNTDDVREAPAIRVIQRLAAAGAQLRCYDPRACRNAAAMFPENAAIAFVDDPYDAVQGADGLLILTEWSEFRTPSFDRMRSQLRQRVIFDGRNLYQLATMQRQRMEYYSIGRPGILPPTKPNNSHAKGLGSSSAAGVMET
jgi:UDPglucose 6-dehydrogenase